jgi:hypothetical protein
MTKNLVSAIVLSLATCAFSLAAFGADKSATARKAEGTIVKREALPANLRGGKVKGANAGDGIPVCSSGRLVVRIDDNRIADWKSTHENHPCADSDATDIIYVCRVGKNLSVRCE